MKVGIALLLSATAALALAACGGRPGPDPRVGGERSGVALMLSPNGEPLNGGELGMPSCSLAMNYWFDRTDTNHDGRIDRDEFLADARSEFAKVDVGHRGFVTSSDLERYRQPFRQGTRATGVADPVMAGDANLDGQVSETELLTQANEAFAALDTAHRGAIARDTLAAYCATVAPPSGNTEEKRAPSGAPGAPDAVRRSGPGRGML